MRKGIILGVGMLALVAVFAAILLAPAHPQAGPWKLSDGSELSFTGATHGTNHTMRYGKRFVDYLYPILTPALRKKFKCQVATLPGGRQSMLALWFWSKGSSAFPGTKIASAWPTAMFGGQAHFSLVIVDENGMESAAFPYGQWAWAIGSNVLECCPLQQFPRRSKEFKVRIYNSNNKIAWDPNHTGSVAAEFTIPNPVPTNYPVWEGKNAPVEIETNGLSVTLTKFEAGVISERRFAAPELAKMYTRAEVAFSEQPGPLEWRLRSGIVKAATGESHWSSVGPMGNGPGAPNRFPAAFQQDTAQSVLEFPGTCWLEEPGWKVALEFERITNFPPDEIWTIKDVSVPPLDVLNEMNLKTNMSGGEIEFVSLSSKFPTFGSPPTIRSDPPNHEIKVRSPLRMSEAHLKIASIRDDQGRPVSFTQSNTSVYRPPGTPPTANVSLEETFAVDIPDGAKSINVTLAYAKSQFVEFLAKPTKAGEGK